MPAINFFNSVEHLEPKCPKCQSRIDYGLTTHWDDKEDCHVCNTCGQALR